MNIFLDDERPTPPGWVGTDNIEDIKELLTSGKVENLSLDHDLGACFKCIMEALKTHSMVANCRHVPTGYDLVLWMVEHSCWPKNKPTVHSANPVGRKNMQQLIDRWFPEEET